jgi:hypothetical protein
LQFAHDNGLVHRDVKPHNLMCTADGTVKVLDFGLAALADDGGRAQGQTGPNAVLGTPEYMAPEQAEDARSADGRADVYGLGCTLFHLLTGKVPFHMESTLLKLLAHRTQERPSATALRPEVPPELDGVLRKAMARRAADRYQSPGELAEALEPFADPASVARLRRKQRRRSLFALAALLLVAATVTAGVIRLPAGKDREIIIQTDDSAIEVVVQGERIVRIADPKTGHAYRLDRGDLTLTRIDDADGLTVTLDNDKPVVLKRAGRQIAVVRLQRTAEAPEKVGERIRPPELPKLLKELAALDREALPAPAHHLKRADLLERLTAVARPEEREQWVRQLADSLSTAAQCSPVGDPTAMNRLAGLERQVAGTMPGSNLAAFVTYRALQADYTARIGTPMTDLARLQTEWAGRLAKFVEIYPQSDDTPEALLQLGMVNEFLGREDNARDWYARLKKDFPDTPHGLRGAGALRRLRLEGQAIRLAGPTLADPHTLFDVARLRGKVVVVYYWASWNAEAPAEFATLKALTDANKEVRLVLVNLDNMPEEARDFLRRTPAPGVVLYTPGGLDGKLATDYGLLVLPTVFLVGKDGKVVNRSAQVNGLEEEVRRLAD